MVTKDKPCKDSWRARNKNGYHVLSKRIWGYNLEHRYVYAQHHGIELTSNDEVCHSCNNTWCIEPTHLELKTHKENMQDIIKANGKFNSDYTEDQVRQVRELAKEYNHRIVSQIMGIPRRTVSHMVSKDTWRHIK